MGDYDDVLTEDDVVAILSKKGHWDRAAICQAARARAAAESARAELDERGIRIVEDADIRDGNYHHCDGECGHAGLVATVAPNRWCEGASVHFYCDDDSHVHQPTPEEIAADEAYEQRTDAYEAMQARIVEFAKSALPKFPAKGQTKLRQWAHEAFEAAYECELDDAWEGFKEPRGKALDQFILMRAIPNCVPDLPTNTLREGYEVTAYWLDDILGFISFIDDVLMPAGYELSEDERDLMDHVHGLFAGEDEDEVFGEDEATEDAPEADDGCPFEADAIDGEHLDGPAIAKAA